MAFVPQTFGPLFFSSANTTASLTPSLEISGSWLYLYVGLPTMSVGYSTANAGIYVQGSHDNVTFKRYTNVEPTNNTLVAGINDFQIASSISSRWVNIPNFAFRYLKLEMSGSVTNPTLMTSGFVFVAISNQ